MYENELAGALLKTTPTLYTDTRYGSYLNARRRIVVAIVTIYCPSLGGIIEF